jgi:23S rRNA (cytosine1962-C5)-methyltransferase
VLSSLPSVPSRRLAIRLTPDALRQVRGGHPWVYAEAITSVSEPSAPPGTLGVVFDKDRRFVAIGLWDPTSPIRLRILHAGKPRAIDSDHWQDVIGRAYRSRQVLTRRGSNGWRLLHGENDGTGGLVIDRYDSTLVCKVYSSCWLPHLSAVLEALVATVPTDRVVLRLGRLAAADRAVHEAGLRDGMVLRGDVFDGPVLFTENGLTFEADVINGQKTGHFLDQRDNRQMIKATSEGARVLDVFSCTGGFSVHAAAGGATHVHSVDIAEPALATAKRNMHHNRTVTGSVRHVTTTGDAFEVMDRLGRNGEQYDVVIIDPPSFASKSSERDGAIRAYRKLSELGLPLVRPGGRLLQASCSSRVTEDDLVATVFSAVRSQGRSFRSHEVTGHALDHPITFPQGAYLKALTGIVDG